MTQLEDGVSMRLLTLAVLAVLLVAPHAAAQQAEPGPANLRVHRANFKVSVYAKAEYARSLAAVKYKRATILFVGSRKAWGGLRSDVFAIVDRNSDGVIDESKGDYVYKLVKDGFNTPHGIALRNTSLFISTYEDIPTTPGVTVPEQDQKSLIWRLDDVLEYAMQKKVYARGDPTIKVITDGLPGDRWHGWRYIKFDNSGKLLVSVGINCNVCEMKTAGTDNYQHGTIYRLDVDSDPVKKELIATGVRNSVGFDFHPDTNELYFTDNGRDELGDDLPDCELNRLTEEGQDFGFPYCNNVGVVNRTVSPPTGGPWRRNPGPGITFPDPDMNNNSIARNCSDFSKNVQPLQVLGPHMAPIGMKFYRWKAGLPKVWPKAFDRLLMIVLRGSWNRGDPIGYRVQAIRVDPITGATREYVPFVSGWYNSTTKVEPWGRPADIEQLPDGSIVISDDSYGAIFRVTYERPKRG